MSNQVEGPGTSNQGNAPLEKDFENGYHLDSSHDPDEALKKIRTTGSLSISPELFEKIYLSPQNRVAGELRKTVGNPTPVALVGFLISLTPLSCALMGWRGSGSGAATLGVYIGFGGILMILGGIGEWILGNTFPSVVFMSFGGFWVAFNITFMPYTGAIGDFSTKPSDPLAGLKNPEWNASWGFYLVFMGLLCLIYAICALRTNLILFMILIILVPTFSCLTAGYWYLAKGDSAKATNLILVGGALSFVVDMLGWYIFAAILLAAVDFPFSLPVFDLSHIIKGASDRKTKAEEV